VNQDFQFVQQFLGAADAERRDHDRAPVVQRAIDQRPQPLAPVAATVVAAVAIGAFQHQDIGAPGRTRHWQQGRVGRAQIAGEEDALALPGDPVLTVDLD
jgi:hypothetical protein